MLWIENLAINVNYDGSVWFSKVQEQYIPRKMFHVENLTQPRIINSLLPLWNLFRRGEQSRTNQRPP